MSNISIFISLYIALSVLIGLYSTKFIKSSTDFCLAGRKLPLVLCCCTMFSTWFGAETVIGASSEFIDHGFLGVIEDPFGTSLCFFLIGVFIARPLYKLNMLTIVDLFREKYGVTVEKVSALFMIISYIGWIAAQLLAMAIIMKTIFDLPTEYGVIISSSIVCLYTISGGMWSISINDFIQTVVIIIGLVVIAFYVYINFDSNVDITNKVPDNFFNLMPDNNLSDWIKYIVAWLTIGLGSIPQQDVFQRVMSANSQKTAILSSYIAGFMYLIIGLLPLFITLFYVLYDPELANKSHDQILLHAIYSHSNDFIKILFFGALLSAIMSSASGAILAPATIIAENIIRPIVPNITDKIMLVILRASVLLTVIISALYGLRTPNVYYLVGESSIISLVSLFVPLIAALYWKKANHIGAMLSMCLGTVVWASGLYLGLKEASVILGLAASFIAMYGTKYSPYIAKKSYS